MNIWKSCSQCLFFNVFIPPLSFYPDAELEGVGFIGARWGLIRSVLRLSAEAIWRSRFISARWTCPGIRCCSTGSVFLLPYNFNLRKACNLVCFIIFVSGLEHVHFVTKHGFSISNIKNNSNHEGYMSKKVIFYFDILINDYSRAGLLQRLPYQKIVHRGIVRERKTHCITAVLLQWRYVHYTKLNSISCWNRSLHESMFCARHFPFLIVVSGCTSLFWKCRTWYLFLINV